MGFRRSRGRFSSAGIHWGASVAIGAAGALAAALLVTLPFVPDGKAAIAMSMTMTAVLAATLASLGVQVVRRRQREPLERLRETIREKDELIAQYEANMVEQSKLLLDQTESALAERERNAERVRYLAYYDGLTGLPNRVLFADRLVSALAGARRHRRVTAVILIDVDRFKTVNDSLGYTAGDRLLQLVSARFQEILREEDTVARQGSDEFLVLLPRLASIDDAGAVARKLLEALAPGFELDGHELHVKASAGISVFPDDGFDHDALIQHAAVALHRAKKLGGGRCEYYQPAIKLAAPSLMLENNVRRALDRGEFTLAYQPVIDLRTSATIAVEALIRWEHPQLGTLPPSTFIPIAEETGLIIPLTAWVVGEACRQMRTWRERGHELARIAVNISVRHLQHRGFVKSICDAIDAAGITHDRLELEVTESVLIDDFERSIDVLGRLTAQGVSVAIDDFGTGYSSLNYLQRMPVHALKIDRSFIAAAKPDGTGIVDLIAAVGRRLGLRVVAEGVETAEQLAFVQEQGCDEAQGFYIAQPMSAAGVEQFLRK